MMVVLKWQCITNYPPTFSSLLMTRRVLSLTRCCCATAKKVEYYFTQKLPKTMAVKRKKDLVLECMLSDPRPHVTWYKNGEKIEVTVVFRILQCGG